MDRLLTRRNAQVARNRNNTHARFISQYVKAKHNHIYMEADQFFKDIQERNPGKKDPSKTDEFVKFTTPYSSRYQYYNRTKSLPAKRKRQHNDNMALNIQLMTLDGIAGTQHESPPLDIPEPPARHESPPLDIPEPPARHESPPLDIPEPPARHESPSLDIPEHVYEELLQEIRKDPDLHAIFNDMDIQTDEYLQTSSTGDNDDMWDVFNICNETTPLESELLRLGF